MLGTRLPRARPARAARRCSTSGWRPHSARPAELEAALRGRGIDARVEAHPEGDEWRTAMLAFHRPVEVAGRLLVRPPWEPPRPPLLDVEIDPGMAFGTAQHATTRSCLALLAAPARRAGRCSTPAAARACSRSPPAASASTRRHGGRLRPAVGGGHRGQRPPQRRGADGRPAGRSAPTALPAAEVLLANLTGTVLRALAAGAARRPRRAGLIASGMRPEEVPGVHAAFAAHRRAPGARDRRRGLVDAADGARVRHTFRYLIDRTPVAGERDRAAGEDGAPPHARGAARAGRPARADRPRRRGAGRPSSSDRRAARDGARDGRRARAAAAPRRSPCTSASPSGAASTPPSRRPWSSGPGRSRSSPPSAPGGCRRPAPGSAAASASERVAAAAARQSGRAPLGRVRGLVPFGDVITAIPAGEGYLIDPRGDAPLLSALRAVDAPDARIAVVVGPQAGFSEGEVDLARRAGLAVCTLGPAVLRAETAAIAAVAVAAAAREAGVMTDCLFCRIVAGEIPAAIVAARRPLRRLRRHRPQERRSTCWWSPSRHVDSIAGAAGLGEQERAAMPLVHRRGRARGGDRGVGLPGHHQPRAGRPPERGPPPLAHHGRDATIRERCERLHPARAGGAGDRAGRPRRGRAGGRARPRAARPGGPSRPSRCRCGATCSR